MSGVGVRVVLLGLAVALAGCGSTATTAQAQRTVGSSPTTAPSPLCDPGGGFPRPAPGCPDADPETGWLHSTGDRLRITPFRTYVNDAEGKAYAAAHHLEYPFSDDHYDARTGRARRLDLDPATICTGIIQVGYREPLGDHVVTCAEMVTVAGHGRLPVAVWQDGDRVVQVSELYRP